MQKKLDIEVHSVGNIMYNINNNYDQYKKKILSIIKDKDINQLAMHLFLRPNCILSMINDHGLNYDTTHTPCLYKIGFHENSSKMIELFLDCMFHFGEILLNEKKPIIYNKGIYDDFSKDKIGNIISKHKTFVQMYLNFSFGSRPCINCHSFVK